MLTKIKTQELCLASPVFIPTLCRSEHFRKCVEALKRNSIAKQTDLIIGLDYPAKDSHQKGYEEIRLYLATLSGFRKVIVFEREENFGSARNIEDAIQKILENYDSFIYLEDDNEVSPNFLEYVNKGLVKFKDSPSVFAICGYSFYDDIPHDNNTFYRQNRGMCVWGYGIHKKWLEAYRQCFTRSYCLKKLLNPITLFKAAACSCSTLLFLVMAAKNSKLCTDNTYSIYMLFESKDVIMPVVSKVRNNGFDGTGEHCGINEKMIKKVLDEQSGFEFIGSGMEYRKEIEDKLLLGKRRYMTFGCMCKHISRMIRYRFFPKKEL